MSLVSRLAIAAVLGLIGCSGNADPGASGGGGSARGSGSGGVGGGAAGSAPSGPHLLLPKFVDLPYVVAGAGGSSLSVTIANDGDADADDVSISLAGDPTLSLEKPPERVPARGSIALAFAFAGAAREGIFEARLTIAGATVPVFGVAGDPGLGASTWQTLRGAGGVKMGEGATIAMPAAPYPDGSGAWDDPSVHVFLPEGYRERGAQDLVLLFHGFDATLARTLPAHLYREQVYASGSNVALVVPQGPVDAPSGDFGKLMKPGGVANLMREVLVALYRDRKIEAPVLGELRLTSHSGGYDAVATNLLPAAMAPKITEVGLFDSMYGDLSTFEAFVTAGGKLRSSYTCCGGTEDLNPTFAGDMRAAAKSVVTTQTQAGLRDADVVDFFADSTHDGSTRVDGGYGEELRWNLTHSRNGPRVELRSVTVKDGQAEVRWLSPRDEDLEGFAIQSSKDGATWSTEARAPAAASSARFALKAGARVRVVPRTKGVDEPLASDVYRVDPGAKVVVVDGFDRIVDGAFAGLSHDFAAAIGESAGSVETVAHRALTEDGFDLSKYRAVIWSLGDESTADHALSTDEQALLKSYLDSGGHVVACGSELGFTLDQTAAGQAYLASVFGAAFLADASGSEVVGGRGALAGVIPFVFGRKDAPYAVNYPDAFAAAGAGEVALAYDNGEAAAVGVKGRAVIVGFPLELVHGAAARKAVVRALLRFAGG